MKRILLVRHGESEWNAVRRLQGQADIGLSQKGCDQALALKPIVATFTPDTIYTSDLRRAVSTAALLGFADATPDARLREIDVGIWTGASISRLIEDEPALYAQWRAGTSAPTDGEIWSDFRSRVGQTIDAVRDASAQTTLFVCHGGVIRAALDYALNLKPAQIIPVGPASLTILAVSTQGARLEVFNATAMAPVVDASD